MRKTVKQEHPIIFSAPMVRAILEGRKTQTRRVIKPQPPSECSINYKLGNESWLPEKERTTLRHSWEAWSGKLHEERPKTHLCGGHSVEYPYSSGDRLWVRETHFYCSGSESTVYKADTDKRGETLQDNVGTMYPETLRWTPSIYMPRWASRITLEISGIRVERVQEISKKDVIAEGAHISDAVGNEWGGADEYFYFQNVSGESIDGKMYGDPANAFRVLWDSINGKKHPWASNPWVWVIEFKGVED